MPNETTIKTMGLLEKIQNRLKASKSYANADGRKESRLRLYRKLKGQYYSDVEIGDGKDRIKVENVAGLTYQMRPSFHFRRPHVSLEAKTPKFITEIGGQRKEVNNIRNAMIAEVALNQELDTIEIEEEVNAMIQDWICPYEFGALKIGYGNRTLYSSYEVDKVNTEGVWALRTRPDDIFVDWQAQGKRSIGYYFNAIHKPLQWIKDYKEFSSKARSQVGADKMPDFLQSRLKADAVGTPSDMGTIYEYHDLDTGQIAVVGEECNDWLIAPYDFPYRFKGPQFVFMIPMPLNNEFYGRCYTSLAEPQIDETNAYRTRLTRIFKKWPVLNLHKPTAMTVEQKRAYQDSDDSDFVEVNDPAGIDTRTMPQLPSDLWNGQQLMERDMEKVLGSSAMRRGEVSGVKPTTAQIIEGHGNLRDADVREEVAKVYSKASSKLLDLMIQFYDTPRWVKLGGLANVPKDWTIEETEIGPFALYSNEDIAGNYDMKPDVTSMVPVNNEVKAKVLLETLKAIPTLPPDVQQDFHRKHDIGQIIYEAVKMQGIDLKKYERQEEPEDQVDPWAENECVLRGELLGEPGDEEPHLYHSMVHGRVLQLLAMNPQDPRYIELARHDQWHKAKEANRKQAMPQPGVAPPGMGQGIGVPGMPGMPGMGPMNGMGGGPMPGAVPPGPALPQVPPVMGKPGGF